MGMSSTGLGLNRWCCIYRIKNMNWWRPGKITFSRDQMLFLLEHLELLKQGIYPPDPFSPNLNAIPYSQTIRTTAYFEKACQLAAEVEVRLDACGVDGKLLLAEVRAGIPLSIESRRALAYVSGWRRKRMSYREWLKYRKYRKKLLDK